MHRLTAYFVFMTCFMLTLVALPRLGDALWGGKSLAVALVFMAFPVLLCAAYFFRARKDIQREEHLRKEQQAMGIAVPAIESSASIKHSWISPIAPYSTWLMSVSALWSGWERFIGLVAPVWFRTIFLVCAVSCGVLGFFLGWEDVRKYQKEKQMLRDVQAQQTAIPEIAISLMAEPLEEERLPLRWG